ncbi:hypothetical protein R1sor_009633 [Riccia sorocarpa]|uniref:Reverse transcriptase zinc-binding domain-containing protein n=1 Tax=Riccia sorocarpa TaxID=122646 RepID=A0ABD3HYF6_9MARC
MAMFQLHSNQHSIASRLTTSIASRLHEPPTASAFRRPEKPNMEAEVEITLEKGSNKSGEPMDLASSSQRFFHWREGGKMHISAEPCQRCRTEKETVHHMMSECTKVIPLWNRLRRIAEETEVNACIPRSMLTTIDEALLTKGTGGVLACILPAAWQVIWEDRNKKVVEGKETKTPAKTVLENAQLEYDLSLHITRGKQPIVSIPRDG